MKRYQCRFAHILGGISRPTLEAGNYEFITKNWRNSLRRGPSGPSSLAPATQDKMHLNTSI